MYYPSYDNVDYVRMGIIEDLNAKRDLRVENMVWRDNAPDEGRRAHYAARVVEIEEEIKILEKQLADHDAAKRHAA